MSLNKHSVRLFIMQRHTSPIAAGTTNGYKNYDRRPHKMSYSSTVLPEDEEQCSRLFSQQMSKLNEEQKKTRLRFLEAEKEWDAKIVWASLTKEEIDIVKAHKKAVMNGHFTYDDTKLGRKVMTRLRHFLRGSCCGNACRHCIYNQVNVPEDLKGVKIFNSAFWAEAISARPKDSRET